MAVKDAYYFPHDSNAKDDPKISLLIDQLGLEGYGIYWVLVETLRDQPDYRYPLALLPVLARKYNTTEQKCRVVVGNYGLFTVDEGEFFLSPALCRRMEKWDVRRETNRLKGIKSGENRRLRAAVRTGVELQLNPGSTEVEQRKEKKVIVKEIKKENNVSCLNCHGSGVIIDLANNRTHPCSCQSKRSNLQ